jgi:hypothetical protein
MAQDRLQDDEVPLTHEFLSLMLGVRRAGVTVALNQLERKGFIRLLRGRIQIADRRGPMEPMVPLKPPSGGGGPSSPKEQIDWRSSFLLLTPFSVARPRALLAHACLVSVHSPCGAVLRSVVLVAVIPGEPSWHSEMQQ